MGHKIFRIIRKQSFRVDEYCVVFGSVLAARKAIDVIEGRIGVLF